MPNYHDNYRWLVEWVWPSTTYRYASFEDVTHDGHTWQRRILGIDGLQGQYIDADEADFGDVQVRLCDLADDGSTDFPFLALNVVDDFEDKEVHVYLYDATTDTKTLIWSGITTRPEFDPNEYTCTIRATFPLDAIELQFPSVPLAHRCVNRFGGSDYETATGTVPSVACPYATYGTPGFTSCDKSFDNCTERGMAAFFMGWTHIAPVLKDDVNNLVSREDVRSSVVPIVIGSGEFKIRPEIYRAVILEDRELVANFVLSGVHGGLPFDSAQLDASKFKLGSETRATSVDFKTGLVNQPVPGNRTIFPDASGHSFVAYGAARFPLDEDQVAKYSDGVAYHSITVKMDGGRKTLRSGAITENPVYALEDCLRDPIFGPGLPLAKIDSSAVIDAASFVGGRFRGRFEIDRPEPLLDYMQRCFATWHGYATFNDGLLQLGAKRDDETAAATFGTGGYKILDHDAVVCKEKDFRDLVNDRIARYRTRMRNKRNIPYEDKGAQIKAGNGLVKVISEEIFLEGIYDDDEAAIAAAIGLREIVNLNLWIEFRTPLHDWLASGVQPGQVIRVNSPHIWNNDSNYLFRVLVPTIDTTTFEVTVRARIYKSAVYAYNADPIGGDLLRDDGDTSIATRPPDVENVAVAVGSVETDDDDDKNVHLICTWDYPDLTAQMAEDALEGIYPKYPIEAVKLYWRYTDESINDLKFGARVRHPTTTADLLVPFHKNRQVEVWFVAVGRSNGQGALGYVLDSSQTTHLDEDLDATEIAIDVDDASFITAGEYVKCESEILKVLSVATNTVTVENVAAVRTPQFDTTASGHAEGTEFGVAVKSHPTNTADLTARRFTLPQVAGVVSRSRPRGVRVKWTNLTDYDAEKYFLYWSIDGSLDDADAWVASWTSQNPKAPTSGINLVKCGKKAHHLIPQEDIDAAYGGDASGVAVQVRVTAKIKNNYSTALSALPGDSPGHHNRPWAPPADPIAGDIHQERVGTSDRVRVWVDVYATSDRLVGTPRTFEAVNTHEIIAVWNKWDKVTADWEPENRPAAEAVEDPSAVVQIIERSFHRGAKYRLRRLKARNPGTKSVATATVDLVINVGDETDDIATITDLAIAAFGTDELTDSVELDDNSSQLLTSFTQPGTPVGLREMQIRKKKTSVTKWRRVPAVQLLDRVDDDGNPFSDVGAHKLRVDVNHPKNADMDFSIRLVATDGSESAWVAINRTTSSDGSGDLPIRSDANGPNYPSGPGAAWASTGVAAALHRNHIVADGAKLQVEAAFQLLMDGTANDQTFESPDTGFGPVRSATVVLQKRNAANSANEGDPLRIDAGIDPTKGSSGAPHYAGTRLEAGAIYDWPETIFKNSSGKLVRSSTPSDTRFLAGRGSHQFDATAIVTATLTRTDSTNNRNAKLSLVFTQPATPVLLKRAVVEVTYNLSAGGGATWEKAGAENLLDDYLYVSSTSGLKTIPLEATHKKNQADMGFRVILVPVNSNYGTTGSGSPNKVVTTSGAHTAGADGDTENTVAPPGGSIAVPTVKWTRKGLRLRVALPAATTDGFRAIKQYGWVLRANDNSTYVTIEGANSATRAGAEFFTSDNHVVLNIRRRDLNAGVIAAGLKVYVRVSSIVGGAETFSTGGTTLGAGGDAQAGYSSASSGTGVPERDAYNDDDGISTRRAFREGGNNLEGGGFYNGRGTGQYAAGGGANTQPGQQWRVKKAGSAANADQVYNPNNVVSTAALFGVTWNQAQHRLEATTTDFSLYGKLGKNINGGRWFSVGILLGKASGTVTLTGLIVRLREVIDGTAGTGAGGSITSIVGASCSWAGSQALNLITGANPYLFLGGNFMPIAGYTQGNGKMWLEVTPTWSGGGVLAIDDVCFYNGKDIRPWTPGFIESGLDPVVNLGAGDAYAATYVDFGGLNDGNADSAMAIYDFT